MGIGAEIIDMLTNFATGIGALVAVVGAIKTFEGFSQDNPASLSQGAKLLLGGIAIMGVAQTIIPQIADYVNF